LHGGWHGEEVLMIAVLNLFDIIPGKEATYAEYLHRVQALLERHGARILFYGRTKAVFRGQCAQDYCGIIAYDGMEQLRSFSEDPEFAELRILRDAATRNYVLTVIEEASINDVVADLGWKVPS
jgi:uncharacterized protein (DUF1330 family)